MEKVICDHANSCPAKGCEHKKPHLPLEQVGIGWDGEEIAFDSCAVMDAEYCGAVMAPVRCVVVGSDW